MRRPRSWAEVEVGMRARRVGAAWWEGTIAGVYSYYRDGWSRRPRGDRHYAVLQPDDETDVLDLSYYRSVYRLEDLLIEPRSAAA